MKIKEFSIIRYGPLPNTGRISLHNFNLFFGKNEDGKTLTIDALVKLLLGRNIRDFKLIDRVEENPEGYVIIEDDKGKEIKLPEKGDLTKVADLTPSECRNIFVIRNSDLRVDNESDFYTTVMDRLTGLRTKELSKIEKTLREIGKITPSGAFRNTGDEKLKTRIDKAGKLIEGIDTLFQEIQKENFDELEEKCARYTGDIDRIVQEIESLEDARKREKYEKGRESLDKLKEALKKTENLETYNENDEQGWRDLEKSIQVNDEEKGTLLTDLNENKNRLEKTNEILGQKERDFQVLGERKKKLEGERPHLADYETRSGDLALREEKSKFFTSMGIISAIILGISLLGVIVSTSSLFYISAIILLFLTLVSWMFKYQFVKDKAWLAGKFKRSKLTLSSIGLRAESIEGALSNIQKFDEEYGRRADELQEIKRKKESLEEKVKELRDKRIVDIEHRIKDAQEKINEIKIKSKEESLEEYSKKLKLKHELERLTGEQKSVLNSHLGQKGERLEENISHWHEEIRSLEGYKDKATGVKYNETAASGLEEKRQGFEGGLSEINDKMASIQRRMEEVQREVNEVLRLEEEYLYVRTLGDLKAVKDNLQGFVDENESNKDNVLEVMKIFEEIQVEEKAKVSELFGKDSPISKHFNEITDGLYNEVVFNPETSRVEVTRRDEAILDAEKLSGGSYDQLYLSIRLALGEKLLKAKKGFFIMDDPFVKADPDRLERQIEMLTRISDFGWQVIYFSAKGEIKDVLREKIDSGAVNYVEVQSPFS